MRIKIPKATRILVHKKYNYHCAYCGCELEYKDMQVDHINSVYLNDDNINLDNLNPSCRMCNFYKSTMPIEKFRHQLGLILGRLEKNYIYRLAKKYNLIEENPKEVKFYFEKYKSDNK